MPCGVSELQAFRMTSLVIIWSHLDRRNTWGGTLGTCAFALEIFLFIQRSQTFAKEFLMEEYFWQYVQDEPLYKILGFPISIIFGVQFLSVFLVLGIAVDDSNAKSLGSDGILKFYVLCFSALLIVPQLLALHGIYKRSPLFIAPYIIAMMTLIALLILIIIIIVVGLVFDPQHLMKQWSAPNKTPSCRTLLDIWLTILFLSLVTVILTICLFIVLSYYKILLKQEEMSRITYIETDIETQVVTSPATAPLNPQSQVTSDPSPSADAETRVPLRKDDADETPPPSYSRAQSIVGHSYV